MQAAIKNGLITPKFLVKTIFWLLMLSISGLITGCASNHGHSMMQGRQTMAMEAAPVSSLKSINHDGNHSKQPRKLIKRSWLTIGVKDLAAAEKHAKTIIKQQSGYIQNTQGEQGKSFSLSIRIPQDHYDATLAELRNVGEIKSENENVQDVTTEFIDNKARLENLYKLRDRIQLLLNRANQIDDILKIERELNRTQSEIDRLEGRMKYLNSQVDYASIELTGEKQTTYGPLGYFFMGIWWGVEKLFVWDS